MRRNSSAISALPPAGAPSSPGGQKLSGKRAQQSHARVAIRLVEQRDPRVLPLLWIDGLAAPKVGQRGLVVAELAMDYSPRTESTLRRGNLDDLVEVIESSSRVTNVHP